MNGKHGVNEENLADLDDKFKKFDRFGKDLAIGDTVIYGRIFWKTRVEMTKETVYGFTDKKVKLSNKSIGLVDPSSLIRYIEPIE
jgi:hypothetical protein